MQPLDIYNNYASIGINSRTITEGPEINMVRAFIEYKKEMFRPRESRNLAIFHETKIHNTYPDVIFVEYDPREYNNWNDARNKLESIDLKVLHYIYTKRNVTSTRIISDMSLQYKQLLHSLEKLMDAHLIYRLNGTWKIVNREHTFGIKKIETVEAKVGKWEEVMQQAIINKSFASESFVLMKRKRNPNMDTIERFKTFGIGIYLFDDIVFQQYYPAQKSVFPANFYSIAINEYIGRILNI